MVLIFWLTDCWVDRLEEIKIKYENAWLFHSNTVYDYCLLTQLCVGETELRYC